MDCIQVALRHFGMPIQAWRRLLLAARLRGWQEEREVATRRSSYDNKLTSMSKPVRLGFLMTEITSVFSNLPFLGMLEMPYTSGWTSREYFQLKTPWELILPKLILLIINISSLFVMERAFAKLGDWQYIRWIILLLALMWLLKISMETLYSRLLEQLKQNIKKNVSKELVRNQLSNTRVDYGDLWQHVMGDLDAIANYHNSFISTIYEIGRMLFALVYLFWQMKAAAAIGLFVGVALIAFNKNVAGRIGRLYDELTELKKRKINLVSFLTSKIQEIKMCRLESYMYRKMVDLRAEELQNLTYNKMLDALCVCNWQLTAVLISAITLATFKLYFEGANTTRSEIMVLIGSFQMLLMPLNMLPWSIAGMRRSKDARDSLEKQLSMKEELVSKVIRHSQTKREPEISIGEGQINCYDGVFKLKVKSMKLKKGRIYCVSGKARAGKSTFLKALTGLVSSNFNCDIHGRVGYVDPTSFHLSNSLCSIFNTLDIRETAVEHPQLKQLMVGYHCLEIPLKNESSTYSGGQKLRLGLVRATLDRDIIIVDADLNSLDDKVRGYVIREMQTLAEREGKIFIIKEERPLSKDVIVVEGGTVKLVEKAVPQSATPAVDHEQERQHYSEQLGSSLKQLFDLQEKSVKLGGTSVSLSLFRQYHHSYLHLMFIVSLAVMYALKNEYHLYIVNNFNEPDFLQGLGRLIPQYIVAVIARSFLFAMANLYQARRVVNRVIRNICFEHVDTYRERSPETINLVFTDNCEKVGNNFPFHANILFNNIAEVILILIMVVMRTPLIVMLPTGLYLIIFFNIQSYYRQKVHHTEDIAKFSETRALETIEAVTKGKLLIRAFQDQQKYIAVFSKWIDRQINAKSCVSLLDRWMTQRFQFMSLLLLIVVLTVVNFVDLGQDAKALTLIITYCVDLADKTGYLVKSISDTEREGRCLRRVHEFSKKKSQLDMQHVISAETKELIKRRNNEKGTLRVKNLRFKYPQTEEYIINNLQLTLEAGDKALIRGKTGAGKTTLFKIFTGLYGKQHFNSPCYISFSPQKPLLLPASLQENLDPYHLFSDDVIQREAKKFSTREVDKLSYSEKLRVNMCRAELYGRHGVIIYDEPGKDICKDATCLIVSHHGNYDVDRKYELREGRLFQLKN